MNATLEKLIDIAKGIAPTALGAMATAAGGPGAGALVTGTLRKVLGESGEGLSDDELADAVLGDPDALRDFRLEMARLENDELRLRIEDTQNARTAHRDSRGPIIVSTIVVSGFVTAVAVVVAGVVPAESENLAFLLLGTLAAGFSQVLNYWLGSSMGSKEKSRTLDRYAAKVR